MKIVTTIEQSVPISLNAPERQKAFRAINLALTGKETIPLHEKSSQAHKDAHYSVCLSHVMTVLVDVYEDGSKKYRIA